MIPPCGEFMVSFDDAFAAHLAAGITARGHLDGLASKPPMDSGRDRESIRETFKATV